MLHPAQTFDLVDCTEVPFTFFELHHLLNFLCNQYKYKSYLRYLDNQPSSAVLISACIIVFTCWRFVIFNRDYNSPDQRLMFSLDDNGVVCFSQTFYLPTCYCCVGPCQCRSGDNCIYIGINQVMLRIRNNQKPFR